MGERQQPREDPDRHDADVLPGRFGRDDSRASSWRDQRTAKVGRVVGYDGGDPRFSIPRKGARDWSRRTMNRHQPRTDEWLDRVRGEYGESPGLTLTLDEAKRLWGLGAAQCQDVLDALVDARFLKRTGHGAYIRNEGN